MGLELIGSISILMSGKPKLLVCTYPTIFASSSPESDALPLGHGTQLYAMVFSTAVDDKSLTSLHQNF